ncbi:MAG: hypothetical protein K1X94_23805 [Sandaracinaceae bacterium]|nr:hypothetical protein [Sandaracinaceae bacterium]
MSRAPLIAWVLSWLTASCGARSGLAIPAASPDAGPADAGTDAAPCIPTGIERCGGGDEDCDGRVDEGLPLGPIAEALTLRTTEFETNPPAVCDTCQWAWRPSLVATPTGFVVPFHLGIYGGREMPALFARDTDASGRPLGEVRHVGESVPLHLARLSGPSSTGEHWIEATLRIGADDLGGFVIVAPDGAMRVVTTGAGRRAHASSSVPLRDGALSVWQEDGAPSRLDAARFDASGRSLGSHTISGDLFTTATLTDHTIAARVDAEGAVVFVERFVSEPRAFTLHAARLDADGQAIEAPRTITPGIDHLSPMRASATDGGYLVFDPGNGSPPAVRFVSSSLETSSAPEAIDDRNGSDLAFDFLRIEGGFVVISTDAILRLDPRGHVLARWRGRLAPGTDEGNAYVVSPDLAMRGGRLFVAWHGIAPSGTPNTVWIRELGCLE